MQVKEGHWTIENVPENFTCHWPEKSERYVNYKEKEKDGSLRKVLPYVQRPTAELMLNEDDRKEMLIVGKDADKAYSTMNSRGDITTKDPEVFCRAWDALTAAHKQPRLGPESLPIDLARKLAGEEAEKRRQESHAKTEAKRKKLLESAK